MECSKTLLNFEILSGINCQKSLCIVQWLKTVQSGVLCGHVFNLCPNTVSFTFV